MGGIAGIFHLRTPKPVDPHRLGVMTDALAHRGPDGRGVWTAPGVGLGHRRLAVIDPAAGAQPMVGEDGALSVVFDGAIDNFRALRAELEAQGAVFRTRSDTEVILHGWRKWGADCVRHFDGRFALALYDRRQDCLFLARDRLGEKPLCYTELSDGCLLFASELKGLLAHPLFRRMPEISAAEDYLAYGHVPDDTSLLAGVRKLPAGHHLTIRRDRALPAPVQWWDLSFADRSSAPAARLEEELVELMRAAVTSRMTADVPLGAFLSGGVKSASVVALMAEASGKAVATCSIGFDQADHDETRYATFVAERFATDHRTRTIGTDDLDLIDPIVAMFDEPFADEAALPAFRACELARATMTVALSGDGADEAFAGHKRHGVFLGEARARALLPAAFRQPLFGNLGRLFPALQALGATDGEAYATAVAVTSAALRQRLFSAEAKKILAGYRAEDRYVTAMAAAPARHALDRAQYADIKIGLPGGILTRVDRASMAVGLEVREPLLDHRLMEFAARLPVGLRLRRGTGKWLMKRALRRYLPDDILQRHQIECTAPTGGWFRGPLAAEARRIAQGSALVETGWFDMAAIARMVDEHQRGTQDHGPTLWQLLMLDRSLKRIFAIG